MDRAAWLRVPGVPRERGGTERLWKVKTEGQALLWVLGAGRGASNLSPFCLLWLSAPGTGPETSLRSLPGTFSAFCPLTLDTTSNPQVSQKSLPSATGSPKGLSSPQISLCSVSPRGPGPAEDRHTVAVRGVRRGQRPTGDF